MPEHAAVHGVTAQVLQRLLRDHDVRQALGRELDRLPEPAARLVRDNLAAIDHAAETHRIDVEQAISMAEGNRVAETGDGAAESMADEPLTARQTGRVLGIGPKRVRQLASQVEWFGSQDNPPRGPWHFRPSEVHTMKQIRDDEKATA